MSVRANIAMLGEALGKVAQDYRDLSRSQAGETRMYAVGIWLAGFPLGHFKKLQAELPPLRPDDGDWDPRSGVGPRKGAFIAMNVEAASPERAGARCLNVLTEHMRDAGVEAEAVRIEVERDA